MAPTSSSDEDDDAFPWQQLGVLAICRLSEPIAFVSIVSYSFPMVQEIKGEKDASFYSGLLISAFAVAEACTAMFWGQLSDRYGRKPMILIALGGTALSSLIFGFAKSYWVALLARVVGGLLNGNVAVVQTMVAEIVRKPEHEPRAYAMQPFAWSLGSILGSSMGGFTAQPARFYPGVFSPDGIFGRFPYLLPNLVAIGIILVAMIQAFFFLKETNTAQVSRSRISRDNSASATDEQTPLRVDEQNSTNTYVRRRRSSVILAANSTPTPNDPNLDIRRQSFGSIGSLHVIPKSLNTMEERAIDEDEDTETDAKPIKAFNKSVIAWTVALFFMCYHQMGFGSLLPIYVQDKPSHNEMQLDLVGGLGLTLHDAATFMAVNSIISLFTQGVIFPIYVTKVGVYWAAVSMTLLAPLIYFCVPFVSLLSQPRMGIYVFMLLQSFACIIVYPCLLILLKNATESPLVLGRVNGLAMSLCSGARTISPPLVGIIYSTVGSAGAWWSCAVVSTIAVIEILWAPRPPDSNEKLLRKASAVVDEI